MAVVSEQVNVYLRAISDPTGFRQFAREQETALRNAGALTEATAARINAAIAGVENRTLSTLSGLRELGTAINALNPQRLRELSNLGFDERALTRTLQQLGQVDTLLSSILSKQNAIVRTSGGIGPSRNVLSGFAALGVDQPVRVTRTGTDGNAGVYNVISSLGTTVVRGQREATQLANQVLIAELGKLRTALLAEVVAAAPAIEQRAPTAVPDLRANTAAVTANTAAVARQTQALQRLEAVVRNTPRALPPGTSRPVPAGPFQPPSGYLPPSPAFTASVLNRLYAAGGSPGAAISGSPSTSGRFPISAPQGFVFAVDSRAIAQPLGPQSAFPASSPQALVAARAAQTEIDRLNRFEQEAQASLSTGFSRSAAQAWARDVNEAILTSLVAASGIYDAGTLQARLSPTAYGALLTSGKLRGNTAAQLPEEVLTAIGLTADRGYLRSLGTQGVTVPGLANWQQYGTGQGELGSHVLGQQEPYRKIVNAIEGPGSFQQRIDQLNAAQQRALANVALLGPAYERLAILDRERVRAAQRAIGAAPRTDLEQLRTFARGLSSFQEFDPRQTPWLHGTGALDAIRQGGFKGSPYGVWGPGVYAYSGAGSSSPFDTPIERAANYAYSATELARNNRAVIEAQATSPRGISLSDADVERLGRQFGILREEFGARRPPDVYSNTDLGNIAARALGYDLLRISDVGGGIGIGLNPRALQPSTYAPVLTTPPLEYGQTSVQSPRPLYPGELLPGRGTQSTPLPEQTLQLFEEIRRAIAVARQQAAQIAAAGGAARGQLVGEFSQARGVAAEVQAILGVSALRDRNQILPPAPSAIEQARGRIVQAYPAIGPEKLDQKVTEAIAAVEAKIAAAVGEARAATDLAAAERAAAQAVIAQARAPRALPAGGSGGAGGIYGTGYPYQIPPPPPRPPFISGPGGIVPPQPALPAVRQPSSVVPYAPYQNGAYNVRGPNVFWEQTGFGGGGRTPPPPGWNPHAYGGGFYGGGGGFGPPGGAGGTGGFFSEFARGFRGVADKTYAFQVGQVAKFSLLYGTAYAVLFNVSRGLQAVVAQAIEFQESLSSLSIVTGESKESISGLASRLGESATRFGFNPAVGVEAGAKAIGIFGLQDQSQELRDFQALQVANIATQQQFLTGLTPEETVANLGAIAGAFQLQPAALKRVSDLDAFFTRQLGTGTGTTLQTLAQTGTLAESAGFSLEEAQVLAAVVKQRTGQTPAAVAGLLSQFYGRAGDPQLRDQIASLGIDVTGTTFAQQIKELALLPQDDPQVRNALENSFGRGRGKGAVGNVIAALGPQGAATQLLARAEGGEATGAADEALANKMENVSGQLAIFVGELKELSVNLGNSGILEVFGAGVFALQQFVELLNGVLGPFSELPGVVRGTIAALIALSIASRTGAAGTIASRLVTRGGGYIPSPLIAPTAGQALKFGGLRALGAGALSYAGPIAAVTAALTLTDTLTQFNTNSEAYANALSDAQSSLDSNNAIFGEGLADATTYEGIISQNEELVKKAREAAEKNVTFLGISLPGTSPSDIYGTGEVSAVERAAAGQNEYAANAAELALRREAQAARAAGAAVFTDVTNAESIGSTLELLSSSGVSATESMRLLVEALGGVGKEGEDAARRIDRKKVATELAGLLQGEGEGDFFGTTAAPSGSAGRSFLDNVRGYAGLLLPGASGPGKNDAGIDILNEAFSGNFGFLPGVGYSQDQLTDPLGNLFAENAPGIQDIILNNLPRNARNGEIPIENYQAMVEKIVALLGPDAQGREKELLALLEYLVSTLNLGNPPPEEGYSANAIYNQVVGLNASRDQQLAALVPGDTQGQKRVYRSIIREQKRRLKTAKPGEDLSAALAEIDKNNYELIELRLQESERLRLAAQAGKSDAAIARIGQRFAVRDLSLAVKSKSIDTIIRVMDQTNKAAVRAVRTQLQAALEVQQQAIQKARELYQLLAGIQLRRTANGNLGANAKGKLDEAKAQAADTRAQLAALNSATSQSTFENTYQYPEGQDAVDDGPTQAQIDAARAIAEATRRGGQISLATAQLQSARADLAAAEEGTVEYYNALAGVYEAQRALAEAIRDDRINKYLLANDITDPVVEARAELKRAKQTLAYDRRNNASPELIREDRLEVERQQANVESTKFQQWLSDLQTAENLERISHAAYIRHLERRMERLKAIKNRTRQEQDQLDEVEGALKAAQETVSGQFNIGDIKVPTPYEVRRYIEQVSQNARDKATQGSSGPRRDVDGFGGRSYQEGARNFTGGSNTINNYAQDTKIEIDGADTAQIIRVLRDILGSNAIKSTATKTGKR